MSLDQSPPECLGDFELLGKVGEGGMGEVYKARQVSLDRTVAVKVLPSNLARQESFIERFRREAMSAASLIHPNVIQIYSIGVEEGIPFFAMEFVEGEDLQKRVKREKRLTVEAILDVMLGVANALSCAQEKGIVHRDIKPSNIMFDANDVIKVMDFGLAKATTGQAGMSLTHSGVIMGTPNYISPEQGRGDSADGRSDIYSLGVVLYELLTGALPFKADTPAGIIFKHVYEQPDVGRLVEAGAPEFLQKISLKMLAKDAGDRYPDARALLDDLLDFKRFMPDYLAGRKAPPIQGGFREHGTVVGPGSSDDAHEGDLHQAATESISVPDLSPPPGHSPGSVEPDSDSGRVIGRGDSQREAAQTGAMGAATQPMQAGRGSHTGTETWPAVQPSAAANAGAGGSTSDPALEILARELAASRASGGGSGGLVAVTITILILGSLAAGGFFLHSQGYLKHLLGEADRSDQVASDSAGASTVIDGSQTADEVVLETRPAQVSFPLSQLQLSQQAVSAKLVRGLAQVPLELVDRDVEPGVYVLLFEKPGYESVSLSFRVTEGATYVGEGSQSMAGFRVTLEPGQELVSLFDRGKALFVEERLDDAREVLRQVEKIDPLFPGLADVLGGVSERFSERKAGDQIFAEALQEAEAAREARDWRGVKSVLEQALAQILPEYRSRQEVTSLLSTSSGKLASAREVKGKLARELMRGNLSNASAALQELREVDPRNEDLDKFGEEINQCQELVSSAEQAVESGLLERAIDYYQQALERMADAENLKEVIGRLQGEYSRQAQLLARVSAELARCRQELDAGNLEEARDVARGILEGFGTNNSQAAELLELANRRITMRDIEVALERFDSAIAGGLGARVAGLLAPGDTELKKRVRNEFLELKRNRVRIESCRHTGIQWLVVESDVVSIECVWQAELVMGSLEGVCGVAPELRSVKVAIPRKVMLSRSGTGWILSRIEQVGSAVVER